MNTILIVEKSGSIKEIQVKNSSEEELYKKAGYKTNEGFKCHTTWTVELNNKNYNISLYGKTTGRANQENKYEFPPPVDKLLFFGNCVLVNQNTNLKKKDWEEIYEKLYGGFEDIGDEDSEDDFDDEDDEIDETKLTKTGYLKDDFIVEDDDEDEDEDEIEDEDAEDEDDVEDEEDDDIPKIKPKSVKSSKKGSQKKAKSSTKEIPLNLKNEEDELYLDCKSELCEEEYIE